MLRECLAAIWVFTYHDKTDNDSSTFKLSATSNDGTVFFSEISVNPCPMTRKRISTG